MNQAVDANATMNATGGGEGNSAAQSHGGLHLIGADGAEQNTSVKGDVVAQGDQTSVQSLSMVSSNAGNSALFNTQNATSQAAGAGSANANAYAILKRKKRAGASQQQKKGHKHVLAWLIGKNKAANQ